ncbi:MAG: metalloregulator ArsR/SmtB family transcription factor [Pseudomonadota bacterium]
MAYNKALSALADPTRRAIVERIAKSPSPVGQIAATLPVSRPAVSQHLKVLSDAGLLHVERQGTRRIYALDPRGWWALRTYLDTLWTDALTAFADAAETEATQTPEKS